MAPVITDWF